MRPCRILAAVLAILACLPAGLPAQPPVISDQEALQPPSAARLAALAAQGAREDGKGWEEIGVAARRAAFAAYAQDKLNAAEGWENLHRWASLFSEAEARFVLGWIEATNKAEVGHENLAKKYALTNQRLGLRLSPALQAWLVGNAAFSNEFFSLLSPVDYLPQVFALLDEMHRSDPAYFRQYASLALAIALVYDLPPPPNWPHGQVVPAALPRRWPYATEAFRWWVREDQAGRTYHRLSQLGAEELKFVVDAAAPFAELEWAQKMVSYPLSRLPLVYSMIRYRTDRFQSQRLIWTGPSYRLYDILQEGGICVDQAYFATEVGKARGVPTLLFLGAGLDGRHAWFGYLDGEKKWQLDAGRYAEQRFITGQAYDPQTWRRLTDHEVAFLAERFRLLPSYRQSRIHAAFAVEFLQNHQPDAAAASARKAVNYERRNLDAWDFLLEAQRAQGAGPVALEGTLREAALAFQRYPDLEVRFSRQLTASLRSRGESSLADFEESRLARKYQDERSDLSLQPVLDALQRSFAAQPPAEQVRTYQLLVDRYGRGAGIEFFDRIVVVFAEHLLQIGDRPGAVRAVDYARAALRVEPGRQLDHELANLANRLKQAE
jgi:hypothetical protein